MKEQKLEMTHEAGGQVNWYNMTDKLIKLHDIANGIIENLAMCESREYVTTHLQNARKKAGVNRLCYVNLCYLKINP